MFRRLFFLGGACIFLGLGFAQAEKKIPKPLRTWQDWATWHYEEEACPGSYDDLGQKFCNWTSRLTFEAGETGAVWGFKVQVFADSWVKLPGGLEHWPLGVLVNGKEAAVVEKGKDPAIYFKKGTYKVAGELQWETMPPHVSIPKHFGLITLDLDGKKVPSPRFDAAGRLWLKHVKTDEKTRDSLSIQVYRVIEDGIPMWLQTELELRVSGKGREEELGWILPQGWELATVNSAIPVAVDEEGKMKAQIRAGTWKISLSAFSVNPVLSVHYARDYQPIVDKELVAFRAKPSFRLLNIEGLETVDVSQTTFPSQWRNLPLYQWNTDSSFELVEKMRGMGLEKTEGLRISRKFWLNEGARGLTYRDKIQGSRQQIWRLDAAEGQDLGAVRAGGKGQLITLNPSTGAKGVEIRERNLNLSAIGQIEDANNILATGWRADADVLSASFQLPPGWRMFALSGVDWVDGDWLTSWTLLDLFLLLIFTLAVGRIWGWPWGLVAFLSFGLTYREAGAPCFSWFFLIIPLVLLRLITNKHGQKIMQIWKFLAIGVMIFVLVPFVAKQITGACYPQLESPGLQYEKGKVYTSGEPEIISYSPPQTMAVEGGDSHILGVVEENADYFSAPAKGALQSRSGGGKRFYAQKKRAKYSSSFSNLKQDSKARIQTGPAEPEWSWNVVNCGWDGPVSEGQTLRPIYIPLWLNRVLTMVRLILLLLLVRALLFGRMRLSLPPASRAPTGATLALGLSLLMFFSAGKAQAKGLPDNEMLKTLRERVLERPEDFEKAAEIPEALLIIEKNKLIMELEIHVATDCAVPLPGRLPSWSPVSVKIVGEKEVEPILRRKDQYLWLSLSKGIHRVTMNGILDDVSEWQWNFRLKPRKVNVIASGWKVTGIRENRVPDKQVFFVREQKIEDGEVSYDRKNFNVLALVERELEIGLVWKVHTTVTRISAGEKALSLNIPLLEGENLLSSHLKVKDGAVELNLGAKEKSSSWRSELMTTKRIQLKAGEGGRWVEQWKVMASPVWNISISGQKPIFEGGQGQLVPVWKPWPGEKVGLSFSKPEAVTGETITIKKIKHYTALGARQSTSKLELEIESSMAEEFRLRLDPKAEITALKQGGVNIPVRRDEGSLVIPLKPQKQQVKVEWSKESSISSLKKGELIGIPVEASNINTVIKVPTNRWILWADGPLRGPAVKFWGVLLVSILAAFVLSRLSLSPLKLHEWLFLSLGMTQIHYAASLAVVGWFFLLVWRGQQDVTKRSAISFNFIQIGLIVATVVALCIFVRIVSAGLLGNPKMFIEGNDSSRLLLKWFQPKVISELPEPQFFSVSIWFYRFLMLVWALWLASSFLRWLKWGWAQFNHIGIWGKRPVPTKNVRRAPAPPKSAPAPTPVPPQKQEEESQEES